MLGNTRHLVARLATRQNSNTRVLAMAQTKVVAVAGNGVDARKISNNVQFGTQKLLTLTPSAVNMRTFSSLPPHITVALPALSPTMESGTIVTWEKKEGDQVSEGDLLCEIETDKATMGFETPEEGFLAKIVIPAGAKDIPIGKLLCIIVENQEDVAKFKDFVDDGSSSAAASPPPAASSPAPAASAAPPAAAPAPAPPAASTPPKATPKSGDRVFASPAAKRVASERGVDLSLMKSGSGMDGMITSKDVENFTPPAATPAVSVPLSSFPSLPTTADFTDADASTMRKVIAKRLQQSKHTIPHYYLTVECNMDNIIKLRKEINTTYEKEGVKLSVNDFIIKAVALSCKRVPECNSAWMDTFIRQFNTCDVSVAVDTGNGLITPIVTGAEKKGLSEISSSVREMAGRAKEGKLQPHEFQGGTITVSNLGMFGINQFTAIINPPQACILAVGGTEKKVVAGPSGDPTVAQIMRVTMSCDHRVVDGAVGAQWLQHFKKFMENPQSMLL